jgi:hypothetical protein
MNTKLSLVLLAIAGGSFASARRRINAGRTGGGSACGVVLILLSSARGRQSLLHAGRHQLCRTGAGRKLRAMNCFNAAFWVRSTEFRDGGSLL